MILECADSHLYPGCRLRLREARERDEVRVVFADGSTASAEVEAAEIGAAQGELVVTVAPYRTARGRAIGAKRWRLVPDGDEAAERWRVAAKLP